MICQPALIKLYVNQGNQMNAKAQYKKINISDVLKHALDNSTTYDGYPIPLSSNSVADALNTSKYQARKYLNRLREIGIIKYCGVVFSDVDYESGIDYGSVLPVWGYWLTARGVKMHNKRYRTLQKLKKETK